MTQPTRQESSGIRPRLGHRPALDGMRGLAISCVVLFHAIRFPGAGFLGVDLFFVLSGFLITTLLLEERQEKGTVSLVDFYRRRALRLLPALVALLGAFMVYVVVASDARTPTMHQALFGVAAGLGYFSNVVMTTSPGGWTVPPQLGHLWSLAQEEQFYVVWPLLLLVIFKTGRRFALVAVATAVVLTGAEQLRLYFEGARWARMGFGVDTRSMSILVGCGLALALTTSFRPRLEAACRRLGLLPLVVFLALLLVDPQRRLFTGLLLVVALVCALLIVQALDGSSALARALSVTPMLFLGRISYSLYLWHVPLFVALGLSSREVEVMDLPAVALALACATASYYFVELPFLRRKRRPRQAHEGRTTDMRTAVPRALPAAGTGGA